MKKNIIITILITITSMCMIFSVMIGVKYLNLEKIKTLPTIKDSNSIISKIETSDIGSILEEQNLKREIIEKTIVHEQNKHLEILAELSKQSEKSKTKISAINTSQKKIFKIIQNFNVVQNKNIQKINNIKSENANLLDKYNNLVIAHNSIHEQLKIIVHKIKNPPQKLEFIEPRKITSPKSGTIQIEGDTYTPSN